MADRKKKRAYLDDFEKDLNGNYQYRGAHYHYKGTKSRGRALAGIRTAPAPCACFLPTTAAR